jgi:hypothetical protein
MSYIPVKLDKTRNLLFGFGALRLFKSIHGKSLMKVDFEEEDIEDIMPLIMYVGLKHEDKELTLEKTVELIDKHLGIAGFMDLMPKIMAELNVESKSEGKNS